MSDARRFLLEVIELQRRLGYSVEVPPLRFEAAVTQLEKAFPTGGEHRG